MTEYGCAVVYNPLPEGGFGVVVPAVPKIATYGETIEEARFMAEDAIRCFLESALQTGEAIPDDVGCIRTERIAVIL